MSLSVSGAPHVPAALSRERRSCHRDCTTTEGKRRCVPGRALRARPAQRAVSAARPEPPPPPPPRECPADRAGEGRALHTRATLVPPSRRATRSPPPARVTLVP